ncbi:MAG: phosphoglycerate dehydrogenase [Christensenellales bacterium]
MAIKVLITSRSFGKVSDEPAGELKKAGIAFDFLDGDYDEERFVAAIGAYDALIIGAHTFTARAMQAAKKLKIVCKHGAGLDNLDLDLCKKYGFTVTNVPGTNSNAVADLAFGLMLDISRRITESAISTKNGKWERFMGRDVFKKTLGLAGFGAIARNVARRAAGFSMKVLAYDPFVTEVPEGFLHVTLCSLQQVLENCDILSVHVPLTKETKDLIGDKEMKQMKRGSYIINTSRGGVVNEEALYHNVVSGQITGAGLDVTVGEPPAGSPLLTLDNVVITSHIGMYSIEATNAVSLICAQNVARYFSGGELMFRVV